MKKKILGLIMASVLTMGLFTGCGQDKQTNDPQSNETTNQVNVEEDENSAVMDTDTTSAGENVKVNIGLQLDPGSFEPHGASNTARETIYQVLYEKLFANEYFGSESKGELASGYEYLTDTDIQVTIYDNIYDAAGNHFTSSDVVFCYENSKAQGNTECWSYLDNIEIVDDYTLIFHTTDANAAVWDYTFHKCVMYTQAAYEASTDGFALTPVTTARYQLDDYVSGSYYTFKIRDDYWKKDMDDLHALQSGNADIITYKIISDNSQMAIALETGTIDAANAISTAELQNFYDVSSDQAKDGYTVQKVMSHVTYGLQYNCEAEYSACADPLVRKAIAYCIDNASVGNIVMGGMSVPCVTWGATNYSSGPDWDVLIQEAESSDSMYYVASNIDKAKELLNEAGYPNGIDLVCMVNNESAQVKAVETIQAQCQPAGINITIQSYDSSLFDTYRTTPDTGWDFLFTAWGNGQGSIVTQFNLLFDKEAYGELGTRNFVTEEEDGKLQELLAKSLTLNASTDDIMNFIDYAYNEQCYFYGVYNPVSYYVAQDGILNIYVFTNVMPQAFTYASDYVCAE